MSHGTLRREDLIPAFVIELSSLIEHGLPSHDRPHNVKYVGILHAKMGEIERRMEESGYYESDDAMYDLEWLFDELDNLAPEHLYFGAHEGDGSDFGYWYNEPDEYGRELEYIRTHDMPDATTFDWAIPLEQFKLLCEFADQNVSGRVVTAYGTSGAFGKIVGLDAEANAWVKGALS